MKEICTREEILKEVKNVDKLMNDVALSVAKIIDDIQLKNAKGDESKVGLYTDEDWGKILVDKQVQMENNWEDIIGILKSNA